VIYISGGLAGLTLAYKISYELEVEGILDLQIYVRQVKALTYFLAREH
jgi:hypothetical protein